MPGLPRLATLGFMNFAATAAAISAVERPLIAAENGADVLMRQAACHVAAAAQQMIEAHRVDRVVIAVGPGGNGGDGLYAGALLAPGLGEVLAVITDPTGRCHQRALRAFTAAGGVVTHTPRVGPYLLIDAMAGLQSVPMNQAVAARWARLRESAVAVLAVDLPTGVAADTGSVDPDPARTVRADVTITFGPLRLAHAVAHQCGQVLQAEIVTPQGRGLSTLVAPVVECFRQVQRAPYRWPAQLRPLPQIPARPSCEPAPGHHKYSGGVVGIVAGSRQYPGAAVLTCGGALRATPSMVRYAGPCAAQVLQHFPEIVLAELREDPRVDCWVVGPGMGLDPDPLAAVIGSPQPLVIDADGLTVLAKDLALLDERCGSTLLTPHEGEAARLLSALGTTPDLATDRLEAVRALAQGLGCSVLLKGRKTLIADPSGAITSIDAGHSWLATPGTGDVLAGVLGAVAAQEGGFGAAAWCVGVHAYAGWLAAATPEGCGPILASDVIAHLPAAVAAFSYPHTAVPTPESG